MKSILDPSFKYTPAVATDIRKTFARARKEIGQQGVLVLVPPTQVKRVGAKQR